MHNPTSSIWASLDTEDPLFTAAELRTWRPGQLEALSNAGVIRPGPSLDYLECPACGEAHVEEVIVRPGPTGTSRFYIRCPEALRVEVDASDLRSWTLDFERVAELLATSLGLTGRRSGRVYGRLWRLGRTEHRGKARDVFLARGLGWPDGASIAHQISGSKRPIVLVGTADIPDSRPPLPVIGLDQIATVRDGGVEVDVVLMAQLVDDADEAAQARQLLPLDRKQKNLLVRRQLKAELKAHLDDDALVAAYIQHGTIRKAAEALSRERGERITKDKVNAALRRRGGAAALAVLLIRR